MALVFQVDMFAPPVMPMPHVPLKLMPNGTPSEDRCQSQSPAPPLPLVMLSASEAVEDCTWNVAYGTR